MFNPKSFFKRKPSREEMVEAAFSLFTEEEMKRLQDPKHYDVKKSLLLTVDDERPTRKHKTIEEAKKSIEPIIEKLRKSPEWSDPSFWLKDAIERMFYRALFK